MPSATHRLRESTGAGLRKCSGGRHRIVWLAGALTALTLGLAACSSGGAGPVASRPAAPSAPSVPSTVRTAVESMERAQNFAFAATVRSPSGTTRLNGQFEAPDSEDLHLQAPNGTTSEVLFVGTKAYQKAADGSWRDALGGPAQPSDPRAAFSALLTARFGAAHTGSYPCTISPGAASAIVKGSDQRSPVACAVSLDGATISALHLRASHFDATIDYSGVGSTPPVPHP